MEEVVKSLKDELLHLTVVPAWVKKHGEKLPDVMTTMAKKDIAALWTGISKHFPRHFQVFLAMLEKNLNNNNNNNINNNNNNNNNSKEYKTYHAFVTAVIHLGKCSMIPKQPVPKGFEEVLYILHENLLDVGKHDAVSSIANDISLMCELFWLEERPSRENYISQTITYLIVRSMHETAARPTDVVRVFKMRECLALFDYNDEFTSSLKELILHAFSNAVYLYHPSAGRLFLVFCFGLHLPFIDNIHATLKNQLATCGIAKKNVISAISDIYYRAWKASSGEYQIKIQNACIQDLMKHAANASTLEVAQTFRKVLQEAFVVHKREPFVDAMLLHLYQPVLWRALKAANAKVRRNAAALLVDAFPLQDPAMSAAETDILMQKQFTCLQEMLADKVVGIRCVGIHGVSSVLGTFWELIPLATAKQLLRTLIVDLANDVSSSDVREAVFVGLTFILDNHLTHTTLKSMLPDLAPLINDTSEKVRKAFVRLLILVKSIRNIHFWSVVSVENILARLPYENTAVATMIVDLLSNSYFPQHRPLEIQLQRCLNLINRNANAAAVFFKVLPTLVHPAAVAKFASYCYSKVMEAVVAKKEASFNKSNGGIPSFLTGSKNAKKKSKRTKLDFLAIEGDDEDEELGNQSAQDSSFNTSQLGNNTLTNNDHDLDKEALDLDNVMQLESLMCCIVQMLEGLQPLFRNESKYGEIALALKSQLQQSSTSLQDFLLLSNSEIAQAALYSIASFVPRSGTADLSRRCLPSLFRLGLDVPTSRIAPMLKFIIARGDEMRLLDWIEEALKFAFQSPQVPLPPVPKKTDAKKSKKITAKKDEEETAVAIEDEAKPGTRSTRSRGKKPASGNKKNDKSAEEQDAIAAEEEAAAAAAAAAAAKKKGKKAQNGNDDGDDDDEDEDEEEEEEEEMRARGIKAALLSLKIFDYLMSDDDLSSTVLNHTNKLLSLIAILRGFFPAQNARLESTNNLVLGPAQQEMDKLLVAALNTYLKVLLVAAAKQVDMIAADAELPPPPDMQQVIAWAEEIVVPALKSIDSDGAFTADVAGSKYYLPKQTMALILVNISDVISCGMLDQPLRDQIISMITALVTAKIEPAVMESLIPVIGKIAFLIFSRDIMTQEDFSFESDRCVMMKVLENTPASQLMSLRFPLTLSLKAAEMYGHVEMTREMLKFLAAHVAVVVVEESKKTGENPAGKSKEEEIKGGLTNISDLISFAINNSGTTCKSFCSKIIAQNVKDIAGFDRLSALLS